MKPRSKPCYTAHHDCDEQQADGNDLCTVCGWKAKDHIESKPPTLAALRCGACPICTHCLKCHHDRAGRCLKYKSGKSKKGRAK